jgi:hypothetical protein
MPELNRPPDELVRSPLLGAVGRVGRRDAPGVGFGFMPASATAAWTRRSNDGPLSEPSRTAIGSTIYYCLSRWTVKGLPAAARPMLTDRLSCALTAADI